jgi:hypothetical protein
VEVQITAADVKELGEEVITATLRYRDSHDWAVSMMRDPAFKDTWVAHGKPMVTMEGGKRIR